MFSLVGGCDRRTSPQGHSCFVCCVHPQRTSRGRTESTRPRSNSAATRMAMGASDTPPQQSPRRIGFPIFGRPCCSSTHTVQNVNVARSDSTETLFSPGSAPGQRWLAPRASATAHRRTSTPSKPRLPFRCARSADWLAGSRRCLVRQQRDLVGGCAVQRIVHRHTQRVGALDRRNKAIRAIRPRNTAQVSFRFCTALSDHPRGRAAPGCSACRNTRMNTGRDRGQGRSAPTARSRTRRNNPC